MPPRPASGGAAAARAASPRAARVASPRSRAVQQRAGAAAAAAKAGAGSARRPLSAASKARPASAGPASAGKSKATPPAPLGEPQTIFLTSLPLEVLACICALCTGNSLLGLRDAAPEGSPLWRVAMAEVSRKEDARLPRAWRAGRRVAQQYKGGWLGSTVGDSVAWSADGKQLISLGCDNNDWHCGVWSVPPLASRKTGSLICSLDAECELRSVALSGDYVVGGPAFDGRLRVWSLQRQLASGSGLVAYLAEHADTIYAISCLGNTAISGSGDTLLMVWDLGEVTAALEKAGTAGGLSGTPPASDGGSGSGGSGGNGGGVAAAAREEEKQPDSGGDKWRYHRPVDDEEAPRVACRLTLEGHSAAVFCSALTEKVALSGSDDRCAKAWDLATGESARVMCSTGCRPATTAPPRQNHRHCRPPLSTSRPEHSAPRASRCLHTSACTSPPALVCLRHLFSRTRHLRSTRLQGIASTTGATRAE